MTIQAAMVHPVVADCLADHPAPQAAAGRLGPGVAAMIQGDLNHVTAEGAAAGAAAPAVQEAVLARDLRGVVTDALAREVGVWRS